LKTSGRPCSRNASSRNSTQKLASKVDSQTYLTHVFEHLPYARTDDAVQAFLPQQLKMADITPLLQSC
jgi:hypothetical protein